MFNILIAQNPSNKRMEVSMHISAEADLASRQLANLGYDIFEIKRFDDYKLACQCRDEMRTYDALQWCNYKRSALGQLIGE